MIKAMMNEIVRCDDDLESFYEPLGLFVKPIARLNITLSLPPLKQPGQSISNWDLMEKIKKAISPIQLSSIRVTLSTMEMVRFEAELGNRKMLHKVTKALEGYSLKVVGFFEPLKVRASEAKSSFPTRHDWDEFFRSTKGMDELKAGERPDTIYLSKMPTNWFMEQDKKDSGIPSEKLLKEAFEQFGSVRCVDIPSCDPYRRQMPSNLSGIQVTGFSFGQEVLFEAYVQFMEYISFMRAMNALRNMKLVRKMADGRVFEASIKVDFDRTKHLSENSIQRRNYERQRIINQQRAKDNEIQRKKEDEEIKKEVELQEKESRRLGREEKERNHVKKEEQQKLKEQIERDEKKLIIAKQKFESQKILSGLRQQSPEPKEEELKLRIENDKHEEISGQEKLTKKDVDLQVSQLDLEAKLRQTLLREQERRLRERIEAKMLLRLEEMKGPNDNGKHKNSHSSHKHRKRKCSDES